MKNIKFLLILLIFTTSCDSYLDVVPDNVATIDYAFSDRTSAEKYLFTCYSYLPSIGDPQNDPSIMGSDEYWSHEDQNYYAYTGNFRPFRIKQGYQNSNTPLLDFWTGTNQTRGLNLFQAIRDCNTFLDNIHKVGPDLDSRDRNRWIAEVLFLKAYYHYYLLRMYGSIPLMKESIPIIANAEEFSVYRDTFEDCVSYLVQLINQATPDLPLMITDISSEMGRITQPIALSVKAEILVMAASPLYNGNPDFADMIDNRGIALFPSAYDPSKWGKAALACKNAIDTCLLANIGLYKFKNSTYTPSMSDTTILSMTLRHVVSDKWNKELIWANVRNTLQPYQYISTPYFTTAQAGYAAVRPLLSPTLRMAELFYSNNGIPIDEDLFYDYSNRYKVAKAPADHKYYIEAGFETAKLNMYREPRFYANLGFDGNFWFGNGRTKDVGKGVSTETSWPLRMKRGDASGKLSNLRFSMTGYWSKKPCHFETTTSSTGTATYGRATFPIIRLADLYLLYAEALNESLDAPNNEVYQYVDSIRIRAGLEKVVESWRLYSKFGSKPATKDGMREIIQQERMIELAFEGKRFWDIRRWKTASIWMNQPVKGWNVDGATTDEYYNIVTIAPLEFTTKEYLWPIKQSEIRINENILQNLDW